MLLNGRRLTSLRYDGPNGVPSLAQVPLPAPVVGEHGDILVEWRIRDPRSPQSLGVSSDGRALGLFVRRVVLVERSSARATG